MLGSVFVVTGGKACHSYPIGQFPTRARDREKIAQEHEHGYEQLPPEINHHQGHLGKIVHDPVGLILGQLRARKISGGDRNRARADRFAARDIVRCIPDHIDLRGREIDRVFLLRTLLREWTEFVAVVVIIGKRAELKKIPDPIMRKLQLRPALHVAS